MMPPKTKIRSKSEKPRDDNQPQEEMPKAQPSKTEGETKEMIEEKSPTLLDGPSTAVKTKDEMWEECVSLQEELYRVQKQKKLFTIERDKAQRSWDNSKRNLEEMKLRMREKLRLKQEAERHHRAEIEEHELKLKQLETAHYNEISELKVASSIATSKTQKKYMESEAELVKEKHILQAKKKERELHSEVLIRQLKQKHQNLLLELNESNEKKVRDVEVEYDNKMKIMVEESKRKTHTVLREINKRRKKTHASAIAQKTYAFTAFRGSHPTLDKKMLQMRIENLKEDVEKLDRKIPKALQKEERLKESLKEMQLKLAENKQQLDKEKKATVKSLKRSKRISGRILKERREVYVKHQQLELKHEQIQQEYDKLQKRQTEAILDVQLKSDLQTLVLERKIKAMTEVQEKKQLELWGALAFGQGDQTAARNIKELFESKDTTIKALKDALSQDLKEYEDLVMKAAALGITSDKRLPVSDIKKSIRNASKDNVPLHSKNFDNLKQELTLCASLRTALSERTTVNSGSSQELEGPQMSDGCAASV